ncbi:hypothetical protein [Microvirga aerophila]|uniref:Uncharacterized protein n=1 Tax=Microvirga aerophila TaxID=670291 RepID=A0A512BQG6_9HYPH|nr:hypothetical protein [Microvirga aerophila]GEO14178.1 hypothetical protein MAE02_18740 [Microvirga aerophila]
MMAGKGDKTPRPRSNQPPLPRPVQEHLGQKLRAQLHELGEKPKYLGDPMVPREFDPIIEKIEKKDRARRTAKIEEAGRQAVEAALTDFVNPKKADR